MGRPVFKPGLKPVLGKPSRDLGKSTLRFAIVLGLSLGETSATMVHDATSYVKFGEILKTGGETLKSAQEIASTATEALNVANHSFTELRTLNSVLGSPLSAKVMSRLGHLQGISDDYEGLLFSLTSEHGDALGALNRVGRDKLGMQDRSELLAAKEYFQTKFFNTQETFVNVQQAQQIKYEREQAARESVLTSLALSQQHKKDLQKDHQALMAISRSGHESSEMNHQTLIQTKLLERIAQNLEKLIVLQAQHLDFLAKTYMGDRGVALGEAKGKGGKR